MVGRTAVGRTAAGKDGSWRTAAAAKDSRWEGRLLLRRSAAGNDGCCWWEVVASRTAVAIGAAVASGALVEGGWFLFGTPGAPEASIHPICQNHVQKTSYVDGYDT